MSRAVDRPDGYDPRAFPPFAVTVDLAVFTLRQDALCALLVQRGEPPYAGWWALPGGFVRARESGDAAARRELGEETGLRPFPGHLEQLATYSDPDRDPRMRVVSVAYLAFAPDLPDPRAGTDAAAARWCPVTSPPAAPGPLAFDHATILTDAMERVRAKLEYTTLAARFVTEPFSLAELRRVYLAVWGTAPDLPNFRRKVLSTAGFVEPGQRSPHSPGARGGRPPLLYRRGPAALLHPAMLRPDRPGHSGDTQES